MMSNTKHLDRLCLTALLLSLVATIGWASTRILAEQRSIQAKHRMFTKASSDLDSAEARLDHVKNLLTETRRQLTRLNDRIPESADVGKFLRQLNVLMQRRHITLLSLRPLDPAARARFAEQPIHAVFEGEFTHIYHFLYELESLSRLVLINTLTISKAESGARCRAEMNLSVFERSGAIVDKIKRLI
jgi:Tfp pilus assembly protein PilO